jgi:pilus assembly protein CpaF
MEIAEKQVTDVVKVDIHLDCTADGKRYVDKISEIVQLDSSVPYEDFDKEMPSRRDGESAEEFMCRLKEFDSELSLYKANLDKEYYYRQTDRISFRIIQLMHYDLDTDTFICDDRFSPETETKIKNNLGPDMALEFDYFMLNNWGLRKDVEDVEIDLSSTLDDMDKKIKANREAEERELGLVRTGIDATNKTEERSQEDIDNSLDSIIDFRDSVSSLREDKETLDLADEFSIGLFGSEEDKA